MKIDSGIKSTITAIDTQLKKTTRTATETRPATPKADAPFSVEISAAIEKMNTPPSPDEISHDRVAAIRDQLASGTYNISGKDVANKILGVLKG